MPALSGYRYPIYTPSDDVKAVQAAVPDDADFEKIGGCQEKTFERTATEIEITSDSSGENRELLDGHGIRSAQITFNGFTRDSALHKSLETNWASQKLRWFRLVEQDNANGAGRTHTGKFKITSFSNTGTQDGAITFNITLMSSGPITTA